MMSAFSVSARSLQLVPANHLETLAVAQHHGLPTRLMDITHSFGVALYFATIDPEPASPSIVWSIDSLKLAKAACRWFANLPGSPVRVETEFTMFGSPPELQDGLLVPVRGNDKIDARIDDYMMDDDVARHPPLAVSTPYVSARIAAQDAGFVLIDPRGGHLGEQLRALNQTDALRGIILTPRLHKAARRHLRSLGISRRVLFPDIDNLAASLAEAHARDA